MVEYRWGGGAEVDDGFERMMSWITDDLWWSLLVWWVLLGLGLKPLWRMFVGF